MKQKHNGGFSLIEVLVAMVLLGALVVPTCSALVMCARMNAKTDDLLQAQLAVSSAVETLMAEGIEAGTTEETSDLVDRFDGVDVAIVPDKSTEAYYCITVNSESMTELAVTTYVRAVPAVNDGGGSE